MMKKSDFDLNWWWWAACSLTNEKIIDFDSHEVHKDSNLAPLHLRSNISPCKTEKNFLENSFIRKLEHIVEQCNLELSCSFICIFYSPFISVLSSSTLMKTAICLKVAIVSKNIAWKKNRGQQAKLFPS